MIEYQKLQTTMPYHWKVQTANEWGCNCVAYVDARQVQDKLDEVVGPSNWQTKYEILDDQLYCHLGIYDEDKKEWIWKCDTGTESFAEKEKGQVSDAFKRAAVQWGIGRFLYSLGIKKTKSVKDNRGKWQPSDENGKRIWDLTKHINANSNNSNAVSSNKKNTTNTKKTDNKTQRYDTEKDNSNITYKTKANISADVLSKIRGLHRDNLSGGDVLKKYLPLYNEANNTKLTPSNLTSDDLVLKLISFIESQPPEGF